MSAALELQDVRKSFGATRIINGVSLSIAAGERHAIIGPNGAGKSTLYNLVSGRFPVSSGSIRLNGEDVTNLRPYEINRKGLARSFQVTNLFNNLSVYENLRCAVLWGAGCRYSFWRRLSQLAAVNARVEEVMEKIGLARRAASPAGTLSYAEQRALEIGVTIAGGASVILLDEPTAGMSRTETAQAVELIRQVTAGKTLLMVEHDMGVVFDLADRISVLVYGGPGGVSRHAGKGRSCVKYRLPCLRFATSTPGTGRAISCVACASTCTRARSSASSGATASAARPPSGPSWASCTAAAP
jgi:branched-chain amino acid transport system ATP-binding protein